MKLVTQVAGLYFVLIFLCCSTLKNNAKYDLADGKYQQKIDHVKVDSYINNEADTIMVHNLAAGSVTSLPNKILFDLQTHYKFKKPSLDIDIITALLKIRPQAKNILPPQLNTNFNGNVYVGYRADIYNIHYKKSALGLSERVVNHFGFSIGGFIGFGNTAMTPSTTNNSITTEYDGMVFQKGVAGIIAINKLTIGLGIGFDNLFDKNKSRWIYENEPWFGLVLGLNLN